MFLQAGIGKKKKTDGDRLAEQVHIVCQKLQSEKEVNAEPWHPGIAVDKPHGCENQEAIDKQQKNRIREAGQTEDPAYKVKQRFIPVCGKSVTKGGGGCIFINFSVGEIIKADGVAEGSQKGKDKEGHGQI